MRLILFLASFVSFLSAQNDFNKIDSEGKKHGLWKGFHNESKRLRYEGNFDHGAEVGTFKYYDDTKVAAVIATRTFSVNGTVADDVFYDQNKNIVSKGRTVNKLKEGEWLYFHKNSTDIQTVENYVKGELNGICKVFYRGNIIAEEATYASGKRNGLLKIYTIKGVVLEESFLKNDIYEGFATFRLPTGEIDSQGYFKNGVRKGIWQIYKNGKLFSFERYPKQVKFAKESELKK